MVKHTLYARPTIISQANDWKTNKKYSSWAHVKNMGSPYQNCVKVDNKFEGAWISTTGIGNLSESYKPNQIKYSRIYLNSKQWNKKKAPKIEAKTFFLQLPKNSKISRMGLVIRCYSDKKMDMDSPTVTCNNIKLPSKNMATEYAKVKPHYITADNGNNSNKSRLYVSNKVPYTPLNLTLEWKGNDLKNITREVLTDPYFGFNIDFKENKSNTGGFVYVDAVALYVEYETPDYELINGADKQDAVIGEEFTHKFTLKNLNNYPIEKNCTKIKIPACFDVVEDKCKTTKGTFERYTGTDYEYIYNTRLVPLNGDGSTFNQPKKGKNPVVVRGTDLIVELQDGYGHPIPYKQVTIKILDQLYTCVTDYQGHAWLRINLYKDGIYDVECSFVDNFYEDCYSRFKMQVVTDRSVSFAIEDRTDSNKKFYQGSYYSVRLWVGDNNEIVLNGKVEFTFINQKNSKDKHVFTHNVDGNGMAYHLMDFGGGNTYNVTLKFTPRNVITDSDGFYKTYFDSATYKTTLKIEPEAKQDAELIIPASRTGYNKYNYDTKQYDHIDDGIYHVGRFHHILFFARDSKGNHILDHENVDIQVTQKLENGEWVYVNNNKWNVYHITTYSGIVPYDFNLPVGTYKLQATLMPNTGSHWNKAVKTITVQVHEPPLDDTYNYMWICDEPRDEELDIVLVPNTMGKCKIDSWNTITGLSPSCIYDVQEYPDGDGIFVLTKQIHRNTDETIDILFQFNASDYKPDWTDEFLISSSCSYTRTVNGSEVTRELFNDDINWDIVKWEDVEGATLNKGYLSAQTVTGGHKIVIMPSVSNEKYMAYVKLPVHTHAPAGYKCKFCFQVESNPYKHCHEIEVLPQQHFKLDLNHVECKYSRSSQQISRTSVDGYRLDCGGDYTTKFYYRQLFNCSVESPFIFIGPVRLHRSHMNPIGSTTQTLLSKQYKNRLILRKKGDYEDKVETTIRMTPPQLATVKGLCKLDMPTPIHLANVPSWNPLTVHGWVELYGTSNEKEINSKIYETKLSWRYLTKELYSLMTIIRDKNPVHKYNSISSFSVRHYYDEPVLDFFSYNGYGTIVDNDNTSDYAKIMVNGGNTETLTSSKKLPTRCRISLKWKDLLKEKSNSILEPMVRIVRINKLNKDTGALEPVFTYTYSDFTHFLYDNAYPVDTIVNEISVKANIIEDGVNRTLNTGRVILDFDDDYVTSNTNETVYTDGTGEYNYTVGSELVLTLNGNNLSVIDKGHSGNEFTLNDIDLDIGEYYIEVELDNQSDNSNFDYDYELWESYLSVQEETDESTKEFDQTYAEHIVSPGAIYNAPLSFTRQGEDGLIYYYKYDNNMTYKYRGDPYNPYKNGTDLCTIDGVSLFDCNNDLSPLCLSNGLVRVAIHRYAGYVEFYRFDVAKQEYVFCASMWTDMDNRHMSVERITDDKIVLNWGTTVWTIWRGRPFIECKHDKVDFRLHNQIQKVYGDTGNGVGLYDCEYNLNLFDYLGKNSTMDIKYIGVGIKGNPSNHTSFSKLTLKCYYEDSKGTQTEEVDGTRDVAVNNGLLTMDYRVGKVLSVDGTIKRTSSDDSIINTRNEEFSYHLMRYNEDTDNWEYYDYENITKNDHNLMYRSNSMGVSDLPTKSYRFKFMFDGDDYYHSSESEEFVLNVIGRKKEPDMKISIKNKDTSRYNEELDSYEYYLNDTATVTVTVLDDENEPLRGRTVNLYWDNEDNDTVTYTLNAKDSADYDATKYIFEKDIVLNDSRLIGSHYINASISSDDTYSSDDCDDYCLIKDKPSLTVSLDVYNEPSNSGAKPSYTDINTSKLNDVIRIKAELLSSTGESIKDEPIYYKIYYAGDETNVLDEGSMLTAYDNETKTVFASTLNSKLTSDTLDKIVVVYFSGTSVYHHTSKMLGYCIGKTTVNCVLNNNDEVTLSNGSVEATYTGTLKDLSGANVTKGEVDLVVNGYVVESKQSITDGTFSLKYTYTNEGTNIVYIDYKDISNTYSSTTSNTISTDVKAESTAKDTTILMNGTNLTREQGDTTYFEVTLKDIDDVALSNETIYINKKWVNNNVTTVNQYCTLTTDIDGKATFVYSDTDIGNFSFYATFNGEKDKYNPCTTGELTVNVGQGEGTVATTLTITSDKTECNLGDNIVLTVSLKDNNSTNISGDVYLWDNGSQLAILSVTNDYNYNLKLGKGTHSIYATYEGAGNYISSSSSIVNITVNKSKPVITLSNTPNTQVVVGGTVTLEYTVKNSSGTIIPNIPVNLNVNGVIDSNYSSLTNSNGKVTFNYVCSKLGTLNIKGITQDTDEYDSSESSSLKVSVVNTILDFEDDANEIKLLLTYRTNEYPINASKGNNYITVDNKEKYKLSADGGIISTFNIPYELSNNTLQFTADFMIPSTSWEATKIGLCLDYLHEYFITLVLNKQQESFNLGNYMDTNSTGDKSLYSTISTDKWYTIKLTINPSAGIKVGLFDGDTNLNTQEIDSGTLSSFGIILEDISSCHVGLVIGWVAKENYGYVKNIKVYKL